MVFFPSLNWGSLLRTLQNAFVTRSEGLKHDRAGSAANQLAHTKLKNQLHKIRNMTNDLNWKTQVSPPHAELARVSTLFTSFCFH